MITPSSPKNETSAFFRDGALESLRRRAHKVPVGVWPWAWLRFVVFEERSRKGCQQTSPKQHLPNNSAIVTFLGW